MKAVFLVTVYRRYYELARNLQRSLERAEAELGYRPEVVLVWARPEYARQWFIRELQARGLVTHVLKRPALDGEGSQGGTTWPESHNIRLGLEFIREQYACPHCGKLDTYVVMHAADVYLQDDTLKIIEREILAENEAVVFHWSNGSANANVWHTNCFGVTMNRDYWPPLSTPLEQDVLERQWGKALDGKPRVCRAHNANDKRFLHRHESDNLPVIDSRTELLADGVTMTLTGVRTWRSRWYDLLKGLWDWFGKPVW